jgi:hypothetical protein
MTTDVGRVRNGRLDGPWVVRSRRRGQRARVTAGRRRSIGAGPVSRTPRAPATAGRIQRELAAPPLPRPLVGDHMRGPRDLSLAQNILGIAHHDLKPNVRCN